METIKLVIILLWLVFVSDDFFLAIICNFYKHNAIKQNVMGKDKLKTLINEPVERFDLLSKVSQFFNILLGHSEEIPVMPTIS